MESHPEQPARLLLLAGVDIPPASTIPRVVIVSPVFNEEAVLPEFLDRLEALFAQNPAVAWGAVLVDDGSQDRSARLIADRASRDPRFVLIQLTRNFGFQAALSAGLAAGPADAVVTMDADLQDPPEVIPRLVSAWRQGADVVRAKRSTRAETGLRRIAFDLFHALYGRLTDYPIPAQVGTFGLMSREALDAFNALPERHRFLPGLRAWVGFTVADVYYDRQERGAGAPKQSFVRLVRYAMDGLFSFSYLPLRLLGMGGAAIATVGFALGVYFAVRRLVGIETAPTGFTTLATVVLFLGGIQLLAIGVLGEYLGRVYDEVKRRPLYIVRQHPVIRP